MISWTGRASGRGLSEEDDARKAQPEIVSPGAGLVTAIETVEYIGLAFVSDTGAVIGYGDETLSAAGVV